MAIGSAPVRGQTTTNPDLLAAVAAYEAGDLQRALTLLQSGPALLGVHDSAIRSVYTGLVYFAQGEPARAREAFARAVRAEPPIRLDPAIHSPSRIQAFEIARAGVLKEWQATAEQAEARGDPAAALVIWRTILSSEPTDARAIERIGVLDDARRAAEATARDSVPSDPARTAQSATAPDTVVRGPIPAATGSSSAVYNPGQALAMGLVVPGLGQVYTGRRGLGLLALAGAGGAVAVGYLTERVNVNCRTVPVDNVCPPDDVLNETTERPYLAPGVAVAAGITLVAAIDGMLAARRANARAEGLGDGDGDQEGFRVVAPALVTDGRTLRAELLRLRFR